MPSTTSIDPAVRVRGTVKWFQWNEPNPQRNFGFIILPDGSEVFCHSKNVADHGSILEGDQVEFRLSEGSQGRPIAVEVRKVRPVLPANFKFG
jgi:cold shock CspA family protein